MSHVDNNPTINHITNTDINMEAIHDIYNNSHHAHIRLYPIDIRLDMSYELRYVGKNSQLMVDINNIPYKALKDLKAKIITKEEINHQNEETWTALHYVCHNAANMRGSYYAHRLIRTLLKAGAKVNQQTDDGLTPLILAVMAGITDLYDGCKKRTIRILLSCPDIDINLQTINGTTALMQAIDAVIYTPSKAANKICQMLLNHSGINVNIKNRFEYTALMLAARNKLAKDVIYMLLDHESIDVNFKNIYGDTALTIAVMNGNFEIAKIIINHSKFII